MNALLPPALRSAPAIATAGGWTHEFEFGQSVVNIFMHAAQDEEVGGDAGIGRVMAEHRRGAIRCGVKSCC